MVCPFCGEPRFCFTGCPNHYEYDDAGCLWDDGQGTGTAKDWVEYTYMQAALDAGLDPDEAFQEGISEFMLAVCREELIYRSLQCQ